jgi:putative tricarboxylic transport membrane protein
MKKYDFPAAPLILGLVLEPLFENSLRQSLTLSHGDLLPVVTRPISLSLLAITAMIVFGPMSARIWRRLSAVD